MFFTDERRGYLHIYLFAPLGLETYYKILDEKGKKVKEIHVSSVGELQGFTESFIVFHKRSYYATYDESFKKIKEMHESSMGTFKSAAGQYMTFLKGSYSGTYDVMFKKISERHV